MYITFSSFNGTKGEITINCHFEKFVFNFLFAGNFTLSVY